MAILSRAAIEALKRDAHRVHEEHGDTAKLDARLREGIAPLWRGSRRFQEDLESVRRGSRRFQELLEAARRFGGRDFHREALGLVRSWRADPYWILLDPHSMLKQRRAAARRIAAAHVIAFKRPDVRRALSEWRRQPAERDRWLRQIFADALIAAGKESNTPLRRIRLGSRWVKDHEGRVREHIAPLALSVNQGRRWLLQRAWRMTEMALLDDDVDSGRYRRRLSRRDRDALGEDRRSVEGMSEYRPTPPATLRMGRLSPRERQVYELLRAGASSKEAAARLKLSRSTIRVLRSRLRAKGWPKM